MHAEAEFDRYNLRIAARGPARSRIAAWTLTALIAAALAPTVPVGGDDDRPSATPDVPDAVIEKWDQHWTLNADGSIVYHETQHVRLNSDRAYGQFADPRITYNSDTETAEVLVARTRRPDGGYVALPEYGRSEVSPGAAGWIAFASLRQIVLVISGIEPGCVLELEYKINTKPGVRPYLAGDIRLDHRYPVRNRSVGVMLPPGTHFAKAFFNVTQPPASGEKAAEIGDGSLKAVSHTWTFEDLPAVPVEPQSPAWHESCARFVFSTGGPTDIWLPQRLASIDGAADESALVTRLATEWTKDLSDPREKMRALQEKVAASFNFVDFDVAWRPPVPRRASEVLAGNYGLPDEAAAVLLSLARAAGLAVQPGLVVADTVWVDEVPQDAFVAAYVAMLQTPEGVEVWHPHDGRVLRDKRWAGHAVLTVNSDGVCGEVLPAWTNADESVCVVRGKVTVGTDGKYTGKLTLRTTGLFISSEDLRTQERQKARVEGLVRRVLADAKVESFAVRTLSADTFEVDAVVKSPDALGKLAECYRLSLAQDGPFLADVPLPLGPSRRVNPVRLPGPFEEQVELVVEWPEAWHVDARPSEVSARDADWQVEQSVTANDHTLKLVRQTRVAQRDLPPDAFLALRRPLNELRSEHARTLLLRP